VRGSYKILGEKMAEEKKEHNVSLYRAMHHLRKNGLHNALGISPDKEIPKDMVEKATHSKNKHVAHMASFSQTMGDFHHGS
jgi:hypothetical protein